jgi:hypothetical protein
MPELKLYSEVLIQEEHCGRPFFTSPGKSFVQFFLSIFSQRNYRIEQRIKKIKRSSSPTWSSMNEQERISHIYRTVAEEKAIERLLKMKN